MDERTATRMFTPAYRPRPASHIVFVATTPDRYSIYARTIEHEPSKSRPKGLRIYLSCSPMSLPIFTVPYASTRRQGYSRGRGRTDGPDSGNIKISHVESYPHVHTRDNKNTQNVYDVTLKPSTFLMLTRAQASPWTMYPIYTQ